MYTKLLEQEGWIDFVKEYDYKPKKLGKKSKSNKFNNKFNDYDIIYYKNITELLLKILYKKICPNCKIECTRNSPTREKTISCRICNYQASKTAQTPFYGLKIPLWTLSFLIIQKLFDGFITSIEIRRLLKTKSPNTGFSLKKKIDKCTNKMFLIKQNNKYIIKINNQLIDITQGILEIIKRRSKIEHESIGLEKRKNGKWCARIYNSFEKKNEYLGSYSDKKEAMIIYDKRVEFLIKKYGDKAFTRKNIYKTNKSRGLY